MCNDNTTKVEYLFWEPNGTREEGYLDVPAHFTMKQVAEYVRNEFDRWVRSRYNEEVDDFDGYMEKCYYDYYVCK